MFELAGDCVRGGGGTIDVNYTGHGGGDEDLAVVVELMAGDAVGANEFVHDLFGRGAVRKGREENNMIAGLGDEPSSIQSW